MNKKFDSLDYLRTSEAFDVYRDYYDNTLDPKVKADELIKFVGKLPLARAARRGLIKAINSPI